MKKFLISLLVLSITGTALSVVPFELNGRSSVEVAFAKKVSKSKKKSKQTAKEKTTETRLKKLSALGISKSFYGKSYGKDLSLAEMGQIISDWIMAYYAKTGQIPNLLNSETADWLVLNVGGQCVSSAKVCNRWVEE